MQTNQVSEADYRTRIEKVQAEMKEFGLQAMVIEPGPAMQYLTGVRWGKSERTFAVVIPAKGALGWVLPGFEEMRARELIGGGNNSADDIRVWQEDESPYARIAQILKDRGVSSGRVGMDDGMRFFVFDGVRKLAPSLSYVSATQVLKASGVDLTQAARGPRGGRGK